MTKEEKSKYSVLILEDELSTQQRIKENILDIGYQVSGVAVSYEEAIESAKVHLPDVALCDIKIEGYKDGVEVAKKLKQMANGNIAIIYLTAHNNAELREKAFKAKPASYLLKDPIMDSSAMLDVQIQLAINNLQHEVEKTTLVSGDRFFAWEDGIFHIVKIKDIICIKGNNNKILVYSTQGIYDVRYKLGDITNELVKYGIVRVHTSHSVNVDRIFEGDRPLSFIRLSAEGVTDTRVKRFLDKPLGVGGTYRDELRDLLNLHPRKK